MNCDLAEFRKHLDEHLASVLAGETLVLLDGETPVAEVRPLPPRRTTKRPIGLAKGEFTVPDEFYEPLDGETLRAFEGE